MWSKQSKIEYAAHKSKWSRWGHTYKAFHNKRDGRTFAQVLRQPPTNLPSKNVHTHDVSLGVRLLLPSSSYISHHIPKTPVNSNFTRKRISSTHVSQAKHVDFVPTHKRFALLSEYVCPDSAVNQHDNKNSETTVVQCNCPPKQHKVKLDSNNKSTLNVCRGKQSNTTVSDQENSTDQSQPKPQLLKSSYSYPVHHSTTHTSLPSVDDSCMATIPIYSASNSKSKQRLFVNDSFEPEVIWSRDCQDNYVFLRSTHTPSDRKCLTIKTLV